MYAWFVCRQCEYAHFTFFIGSTSNVTDSLFLKSATIDFSGSTLTFVCDFYKVQNASCILVGRKYGNKTLLFWEMTSDPVHIDSYGNYTFSVFGKNNTQIDEVPIITKKISIIASHAPGATPTAPGRYIPYYC